MDGGPPLDHPTNAFTMVVPFVNTGARPKEISPPNPQEPLWQGLDEGGGVGFYSIMPTSQEKN
jgi:hypothetical protein